METLRFLMLAAGLGACSSAAAPAPEPVGTAAEGHTIGATGTCGLVTLSAGVASPQSVGAYVTFTAAASCAGTTAEYRFRVRLAGESLVVERPWSNRATWEWNTALLAAGSYEIDVEARASGTTGRQASSRLAYSLSDPCGGGALCGGKCVKPRGDKRDCGGCGIVCKGTCKYGVCTVTLADSDEPGGLVSDADNLYWSTGSALWQMPKRGGAPISLASPYGGSWNVAVQGSRVYWTDEGQSVTTGHVLSVPIGGGAKKTLASGLLQPQGILADATSIYFTTGTGVGREPLAGGAITTLAAGSNPYVLAVRQGVAYAAGYGTIVKIDGAVVTTLTPSEDQVGGLAIDRESVYWIASEGGPGDGYVAKVGVDGGAITTLVKGRDFPGGLAIDHSYLYWGDQSAIMRVPLAGGTAITLADADMAWGLAIDDENIYWANFDSYTVQKATKRQ